MMTTHAAALAGLLLTFAPLVAEPGPTRARLPDRSTAPVVAAEQALRCSTGLARPGSTAIGFLGDSITHNRVGGASPGEVAARILHARPVVCGVSGSSTGDWLRAPRFQDAVAAFRTARVGLISIMLGTNDCRRDHPIPATVYRTRLLWIVAALQVAGFRVALQTPPLATNPRYDPALPRQYRQVIASLALPGTRVAIHLPTYDGVHPDARGVRLLGAAWAAALAPALARLDGVTG